MCRPSWPKILARKCATVAATIAVFTCVMSTALTAQTRNRDFWALNYTGGTVVQLWVADHNSPYWGSEVLQGARLESGLGVYIHITGGGSCFVDFKLVYSNGSTQEYRDGRDVCAVGGVEFGPSVSRGWLWPRS